MALGTDFSGGVDIDGALREAPSANHALLDCIVRRLTTSPGELLDFPTYGFNVRDLIGSALSDSQIRAGVLAQCYDEEEVENATCEIQRTGESVILTVSISSTEGPFSLTLTVDKLTAELIYQGAI